MTHTSTINFLQPLPDLGAQSRRARLLRRSWMRRLTQPITAVDSIYGQNGAFIFDRQLTVSGRSSWSIGLAAVVILAMAVSYIYPLGQHQIVAARAASLPVLQQTLGQSLAQALVGPRNETSVGSENVATSQQVVPATDPVAPSSAQPSAPASTYQLQRQVYAFLPYWFVGKTGPIDYDKLSTLAYFGVEIEADGSFDQQEPGWTTLHSSAGQEMMRQIAQHQTRPVLTYRAFNQDQITGIVTTPESRQRAAQAMVALAKEQGFKGANIDFENADHPDEALRHNFTAFVAEVTNQFHQQISGSEVMVSTYASAAKYFKLYDVAELAKSSDGLFVMAYDFHTVGSSKAGPVAPLTGAPGAQWYDVTSTVRDHLAAGVPANKMILGVPYYGYDWPVTANEAGAEVGAGKPSTSSYKGSIHDPENTSATRRWDETSQTPYYTYYQDGSWRITYYDDATSLGKKYDLVNTNDLLGVGIWALGQEGDAPELWQLLFDKFGKK